MLKLYNQLSRKIEPFVPIDPNQITIYTCGPTVYNRAHIGNLAAYIYWDLLIRVLIFKSFKVRRVLNLTDVGHLTSDADEGEDKLETGARRDHATVWELADRYIAEFKQDFHALNLTEPAIWARATDYIPQDLEVIKQMQAHGFLYETRDGLYFDTAKFPGYANFARLDLTGLQAGARVEFSTEKRNPSDFAVWKFIQPNETHAMRWQFQGKWGYPGWHLECSTIIAAELNTPIDIHTGGIDHIPIHHTNEIAQTYAINHSMPPTINHDNPADESWGAELARFWLHANFITINRQKLSKSLGNTYTLDDLENRGFSPLDFKLWVISGHYRSARNFNFEELSAAKARRLAWRNRAALAWQKEGSNSTKITGKNLTKSEKYDIIKNIEPDPTINNPKTNLAKILKNLEQDLNGAATVAEIDSLNLNYQDWVKIERLFGLGLTVTALPNSEVQAKLAARAKARAAHDFTTADQLRREISAAGFDLLDTKTAQFWQYRA